MSSMCPSPSLATHKAITHYENFPVASWLCPAHLRGVIAAIYHFARTADDIADEGSSSCAQRLQDLAEYRLELDAAARGGQLGKRWSHIFEPLKTAIRDFSLPVSLLGDLLDAFCQDVRKTRDRAQYANRTELLEYCGRSANPIGRLLLHLYGLHDPQDLQKSDAICTALQLINFWQDLSVDMPRDRYYLPQSDCQVHQISMDELFARQPSPKLMSLIKMEADWARHLMQQGAPLVHRLPGRAGWELRLVVQGGLRILEKIESLKFDTLTQRPVIRPAETPLLLWRALRM